MLEAHIVSPRGSLYYAGGTTAYDLETIRQHLRDALPDVCVGEVELEVIVDDPAEEARVGTWLRYIGRSGIKTRLFVATPADDWSDESEQPVASVA
jgi:hypothetical protein